LSIILTLALQVSAIEAPYKAVAQNLEVSGHRLRIEQVYREQRVRLWRALIAYTGDPDAAEEAVAETFAQALARGEGIRHLDRWVWRTAFRVVAGEMQRRRKSWLAPTEPVYQFPETIDHVVKALARVSPKQRIAVILHDYADWPTEEVATILGVSRATVHVHLSQGRRRLRRLLEVEDG
jgi:RNA polymerase sigma factor (sigma-70 family)